MPVVPEKEFAANVFSITAKKVKSRAVSFPKKVKRLLTDPLKVS